MLRASRTTYAQAANNNCAVKDRRFIGSAFTNPDIVNGAPVAYEPGTPRSLIVSLSIGSVR